MKYNFVEQEGPEEHSTEMCASTSTRTFVTRCTTQHTQARCWTVQQSITSRFQGQKIVCYKCRVEEDPGDKGRARLSISRIYQHNKQLLSRGNCEVSYFYQPIRRYHEETCFMT